jgi:ABC-type branched-subunit amino acid transport system substrate-binding protein
MKIFYIPLLTVLVLPVYLDAQEDIPYNPQAETYFIQALKNFEQQNYVAAAMMFQQVEKDYPLHQRTTAAIIMEAKSLFHIELYDSSIHILENFLDRFSGSTYGDDARFTLGQNYYVQHRYHQVVSEMMSVITQSDDPVLITNAEALLIAAAVYHLPGNEISALVSGATGQKEIVVTSKIRALKYAVEGEFTKASDVLHDLIARYPLEPRRHELDSLIGVFQKGKRIKIGLLLPFLGSVSRVPEREFASEILVGAQYAADEFSRSSTVRVGLEPRETQRDLVKIAQEVEGLITDREVIGVIGPIFSDEVEVAGRIASRNGLPLVTPTATATGLTRWGKEVFQANPDYMIRGTLMAQFAVDYLGLKTFAVLHSTEGFSTQMAESFIAEARRRGAQVIVSKGYERGGGDMQNQMTAIRNESLTMQHPPTISFSSKMKKADITKFLKAGIPQTMIDSLIDRSVTLSAGSLFGPSWKIIIDSLHVPVTRPFIDTIGLDTPALGIEALYAPIASPDEIGIIGAQLTYYNIRTQILGSGDWYRIEELDANNKYVNGVYFDADTYTTKDDSLYAQFCLAFQKATGRQPTKNVLIGYDSMKMILSQVDEKDLTRPDLIRRLTTLGEYRTLHSIITFTKDRVNGSLAILQYKNGQIKKITHEFWKGD